MSAHLHVFDGIDRDAGHAHIARHTGMIGIVTPVRREVKSNAQPLLTCDTAKHKRDKETPPPRQSKAASINYKTGREVNLPHDILGDTIDHTKLNVRW